MELSLEKSSKIVNLQDRGFGISEFRAFDIIVLNSLIIHKIKTKEITRSNLFRVFPK